MPAPVPATNVRKPAVVANAPMSLTTASVTAVTTRSCGAVGVSPPGGPPPPPGGPPPPPGGPPPPPGGPPPPPGGPPPPPGGPPPPPGGPPPPPGGPPAAR